MIFKTFTSSRKTECCHGANFVATKLAPWQLSVFREVTAVNVGYRYDNQWCRQWQKKCSLQTWRWRRLHCHFWQTQVVVMTTCAATSSDKVGTWHDSCVFVAYVEFCNGMISYRGITLDQFFHRIWITMEKSFVKWAPGCIVSLFLQVMPRRIKQSDYLIAYWNVR